MNIPQVGSKITVTTRYNMRSFWNDLPYQEHTTTGTVLPSPKWLQPNEFALSNPNHLNGFSIINLNRVVDLRDAEGKKVALTIQDSDYKQWTVKGSKGNSYLVIRQKGQYNCSCPGFTYRKHCRHIEETTNE